MRSYFIVGLDYGLRLEYWRIADVSPGRSPDIIIPSPWGANIDGNVSIKPNPTFLIINDYIDDITVNSSYAVSALQSILSLNSIGQS